MGSFKSFLVESSKDINVCPEKTWDFFVHLQQIKTNASIV
jgi:hypothetical protein